jgi:amino acid adenylation domain-containing protein
MPSSVTLNEVESFITRELAGLLGARVEELRRDRPLRDYGLDSSKAAQLVAALSRHLSWPIPLTTVWDHPTLDGLCRAIARGPATARGGAGPRASSGSAMMFSARRTPIAVVGVACRFPCGPDPASFWRMLVEGQDAVRRVPANRWDPECSFDSDPATPGRKSSRWGAFLDSIDQFDPLFFGISPREAASMDPQQRLMLELSWEALEDAGIAPSGLRGSQSGVFFGASWSDYGALAHLAGPGAVDMYSATGVHYSIIANRVSYLLGLEGPSMAVDAACSSSLVAVHLACQSLWTRESELCLAGGVNLNFFHDHMLAMSKLGVLSPDGRCKAFDARADGYVRGEGGGVVVLCRLEEAVARGWPIYCTIRGSAVNNDGLSNGLTSPNPRAQEAMLRRAYESAGIPPGAVDYVETHGTGTRIGDPIEAGALGAVLGEGRRSGHPLRIGSVKTNIGHLEAAAGIAGLIKTVLATRNGILPASLHFHKPNPSIPFGELGLDVQRHTTPWPRQGSSRVAGVSGFGFGGTNAHVVLEEACYPQGALLLLGAEDAEALRSLAAEVRDRVRAGSEAEFLPALCREVASTAERGPWRLSAAARSADELRGQLDAFLSDRRMPGLALGDVGRARRRRVAFVCSATGSQWAGMGRQLLLRMPVFRATMLRCDAVTREALGWSIIEQLLAPAEASRMDEMDVVQPLLVAMQIALADTFRALGVEPDIVVGQSVGEISAAYVTGALTLEEALRVVAHRSRVVRQMASGRGKMMVVDAPADALAAHLADQQARACVAAYNSPRSTVVAGDADALVELHGRLQAEGVEAQWIRVDYASHGHHMDPLVEPVRAGLAGITPRAGRVPMISTVTGARIEGAALGPDYWAENLRRPVRLMQALQRLDEEGVETIVELSPHPILQRPVRETLPGAKIGYHHALQRGEDEAWSLLSTLGALYVEGYEIVPHSFLFGDPGRHRVPSHRAAVPALRPAAAALPEAPRLVAISGHTDGALRDACRELSNYLERRPDVSITDVAYTLGVARAHRERRAAFVARSRDEALEALAKLASGEVHAGVFSGSRTSHRSARVVFVFPGQGAQRHGMGRDLLRSFPSFRASMEHCDALVRGIAGWSLLDELRAAPEQSRLDRVEFFQPLSWALQVSLAATFAELGIVPDAVVGHSLGEIAAACVSGGLSLEDGARVVCARSDLLSRQAAGRGEMVAVELSEREARPWIERYEGRIVLAVENGPTSIVLAGASDAVQRIEEDFGSAGVWARRIASGGCANHSPHMDDLLEPLRAAVADIRPAPFQALYCSTSMAGTCNPVLDADYWAANLRCVVRFAPVIDRLIGEGHDSFVEISPHPTLVSAIEDAAARRRTQVRVTASLDRKIPGTESMLRAAASLFVDGLSLRFDRIFPDGADIVDAPRTCWQRDRYWIDAVARTGVERSSGAALAPRDDEPPAAAPREGGSNSPRDEVVRLIAALLQLPEERIAPDRHLVEFGLDSLLSVKLTNDLRVRFGAKLSPATMLRAGTIDWITEQLGGGARPPARDVADAKRVPATRGEAALWFLHQLDPESPAYNLMFGARIGQRLDVEALRRAVHALVERHPALRTTYAFADGRVLRCTRGAALHEFTQEDASTLDDAVITDRIAAYAHRPFDLQKGPVFRCALLTRRAEEHYFVLAVHHIAADAASIDVLVCDLLDQYASSLGGAPATTTPSELHASFAEREQRWLASPEAADALAYWSQYLVAAPPPVDIPRLARAGSAVERGPSRPRASMPSFAGDEYIFRWGAGSVRPLQELAAQEGVTLYALLLAGLFATLHRVTGAEEVALGSIVSLRDEPEMMKTVGYLVNTVVMRSGKLRDASFREVLHRVQGDVLQALEHKDYPLSLLTEQLGPVRTPGRQVWFDMILNWLPGDAFEFTDAFFLSSGRRLPAASRALRLEPISLRRRIARFDVELTMALSDGELIGAVQFNTDVFDRETVETLVERLRLIMVGAAERPDLPLAAIPMLEGEEWRLVVEGWNQTASAFSTDRTLHGAFLEQVRRVPEASALHHGGRPVSYRELDERSAAIADALRAHGAGPGIRVGIAAERSPVLVAGLLGILRTGATYVPLDPAYPAERLALMLEDSQASIVVTSRQGRAACPIGERTVLVIEDDFQMAVEAGSRSASLHDEQAAYIIYTSGSTGQPKGVVVGHRSCAALFHWADGVFTDDDVRGVLAWSSPCFDFSVFQIFYPLSRGGAAVLVDDVLQLPESVDAQRVTMIAAVPSLISALLDIGGAPSTVRTFVCGGEPCRRSLVDRLHALPGVRHVYNGYGPTETTVFATVGLAPRDERTEPTIGRPIENTRAYVLDSRHNPVPPGIVGELFLGGAGVAYGYNGQPERTKERFLPDPFHRTGARMYRTGDLVRFRADGELEYVGRADFQVKVRGYRIELEEVETHILRSPEVLEAAVTVIDAAGVDPGASLVAYVVPRVDVAERPARPVIDAALQKRILNALMTFVPAYMVPHIVVSMPSLPRTQNGKADRARLPPPPVEEEAQSVELRSATEAMVASLWAEVLQRKPDAIPLDRTFYELGGHSLLLPKLLLLLRGRFGRELRLADVFRLQTVARIARWLDGEEGAGSGLPEEEAARGAARRARLLSARKRAGGTQRASEDRET